MLSSQKKGSRRSGKQKDNKEDILLQKNDANVYEWENLSSEIGWLVESLRPPLSESYMKVIKDFMAGNLEVRREILSSEDLRQLYSLVFRKMSNAGIWKAGLGHLLMDVSTGVTCEPLREWSKNQKYIPLGTSIVMDAACPLESPKHYLRRFQSFFVFTTEGIDEKSGLLNDDYRPDKRCVLRQFLKILREAYHQAEFYGAHVTPTTITFVKHTGGSEFWESKPIPADMIEEYVRNKDKKPSEDMKSLFKLLIGIIMKSVGDVKMCSHEE